MQNINKKNPKKTKITVVVLLGLLLVFGVTYVVYAYAHKSDDGIRRDASGTSVERTPQDKVLEENLEKNPSDKTNHTQTDTPAAPSVDETTNLQKVNVVLTSVGKNDETISASGFVSNIVESNGKCTYIFTDGRIVYKKEATTLTNANSTTCKSISFSANELGSGVWKVSLTYSSASSTGTSNELEVKL